jgi:hypothetical protein
LQTVWKFPLVRITDSDGIEISHEVLMPRDACCLSVMSRTPTRKDPSVVNVYALIDTNQNDAGNYEEHRFQIVGTGQNVEDGLKEDDIMEFIDTVSVEGVLSDGYFHVFEVKKAEASS